MDMNMKSRLDLKNKKTKMAASLLQKFVLVLAFFVMMNSVGYAGPYVPFLLEHPKIETFTEITLLDGTTVEVVDRTITSEESVPDINNTWDSFRGGYYDNSDNEGTDDNDVTNDLYYTGFYLGTFNGNDGLGNGQTVDIKKLIKYFLDFENETDFELLGYAKDDDNENIGDLSVTINTDAPNSLYSGTWEVQNTETQSLETINFYSVKGSTEFALYYVDPAQSSGKWTTAHLYNDNNIPAISHFSVAKINIPDIPDENPVPEPATMLLFGFSLMGLAGMARRKNSKF